MKKIYQIAIVGLIILLLFLFRGYVRDTIITSLGGYLEKETDTIVDIKYKIGKIDTLEVFNSYVKTRGITIGGPEIITEYITIDNKKVVKDTLKKYNVKIEDSLISGTFTVYNKLNGDLKDSYFDYIPKFPKLIRRVDTVEKTITIKEVLSNEKALMGVGIGATHLNTDIYGSILGSYQTKKNLQFIVEVGKPISTPQSELKSLNNTMFSLKVIKQF